MPFTHAGLLAAVVLLSLFEEKLCWVSSGLDVSSLRKEKNNNVVAFEIGFFLARVLVSDKAEKIEVNTEVQALMVF